MTTPRPVDDRGREIPGDTNAPDIVGPTGEEMPVATHDGIDTPPAEPEPGRPLPGKPLPSKSKSLPSANVGAASRAGTKPAP